MIKMMFRWAKKVSFNTAHIPNCVHMVYAAVENPSDFSIPSELGELTRKETIQSGKLKSKQTNKQTKPKQN